jgi:hypothetical protein
MLSPVTILISVVIIILVHYMTSEAKPEEQPVKTNNKRQTKTSLPKQSVNKMHSWFFKDSWSNPTNRNPLLARSIQQPVQQSAQ